ncbi:Beta-1 4-N-acetylgalactosaminyltransferase bre-4 [Fasciola gigantica]|uniref:Beta-1,4-galactosyltransferase n=1 Tax=Fasciola gigantica TaxID=46835 RepID=A0A504YUV8_FASGI|nr:Beta-1 4-N-acetylgalactosaminyltransferase bre-4 [Fasciola gigantica]
MYISDLLRLFLTDLDPCVSNTALSTMNFTLNLTIPDWMELLSEYIPLKQHKSGWTVYRLPNNQYYLDNQTIIKSNKTANHSKIAEFGQDLLLARVNLSLALWSPILCEPQESTAIIIPYRNREEHLRALLHTLPAFLIHQNVRFTIFVIEQMSNTRFNRALLFNVGFIESKRIGHFDCYIFHDVDLLPADLRVPYSCGSQPVHLAASMDKFGYRLPYRNFVGGVLAMSGEQFAVIGGFSNYYFGWGGEDDDMFHRIKQHSFSVIRPKMTRYRMIRHGQDKLNERNKENLQVLTLTQQKALDNDGYLQSDYQVLTAGPRYSGLVYWIEVDVHETKLTAQRDSLLKGK